MKGLPRVLSTHREETQIALEIIVPEDCVWFEGHFPSYPILPGVVQIGWAAHFATKWHWSGEIKAMEQIKFRRPILPGARLVLSLAARANGGKLGFEYRDAGRCCSSGTFRFGDYS